MSLPDPDRRRRPPDKAPPGALPAPAIQPPPDFDAASSPLHTADVCDLLQLFGEIAQLRHDRIAWRRHLLVRLCHLTRANCGLSFVAQSLGHRRRAQRRPYVSLAVEHNFPATPAREAFVHSLFDTFDADPLRAALLREIKAHPGQVITRLGEELVPHGVLKNDPHLVQIRKPAGLDHCVLSACPAVPDTAMIVAIYRTGRRAKRFTERERALMDLCNGALKPFYRAEHQTVRNQTSLSPRLQQTLNYLMAGKSEKEIADALKLSRHTIHDYIKAIYRHFDVQSRSELLARFIT